MIKSVKIRIINIAHWVVVGYLLNKCELAVRWRAIKRTNKLLSISFFKLLVTLDRNPAKNGNQIIKLNINKTEENIIQSVIEAKSSNLVPFRRYFFAKSEYLKKFSELEDLKFF